MSVLCVPGKFYTQREGVYPSLEFRVKFYYGEMGVPVSPWHNIPHKNPDGTFNFICEIPKWTRRKFEIATGEPFNAIKQDVQNGLLRQYAWGGMCYHILLLAVVITVMNCVRKMRLVLPQAWNPGDVSPPG